MHDSFESESAQKELNCSRMNKEQLCNIVCSKIFNREIDCAECFGLFRKDRKLRELNKELNLFGNKVSQPARKEGEPNGMKNIDL